MDLTQLHRAALVERLLAPSAIASGPRTGEACVPPATTRADRVRELLDVAKELLLRDLRRDWQNLPLMNGPGPLRDWLRLYFGALEHEVFVVIYLDAHHRVIGVQDMFRGSLSQTSVYPREVVKAALARNAAAVAFAHSVARHRMGVLFPGCLCSAGRHGPGSPVTVASTRHIKS